MPSLRGPSRPGTKSHQIVTKKQFLIQISSTCKFDGVVTGIMAKTGAKEKDCDSPRGKGRDMERFAKEREKNERIEEIKDWRPDTEGLRERTTQTMMNCLQQLWLGRLWLRQCL